MREIVEQKFKMAQRHGIRWSHNFLKSLDKDIIRLNCQLARGPPDERFLAAFKSLVPRHNRLIFPEVIYYSAMHLITCGTHPHLLLDRPFHTTSYPIINNFLVEMEESYPSMCFDFRPLTAGEFVVLARKFGRD